MDFNTSFGKCRTNITPMFPPKKLLTIKRSTYSTKKVKSGNKIFCLPLITACCYVTIGQGYSTPITPPLTASNRHRPNSYLNYLAIQNPATWAKLFNVAEG